MPVRTAVATSVLALAVGCAGQGSSGSEQAQRSAGQSISEPSTAAQEPTQPPLPAEQTISARISEVETHDSRLLLFRLVVRG